MLRTIALSCAAALLLTTGSALGQGAASSDAELKEILAYRLTLPVLKQVAQATRHLVEELKSDPRYRRGVTLQAELETLEAKDDPTGTDIDRMEQIQEELDAIGDGLGLSLDGDLTLAQVEARLQTDPLFAKALRSADLSPREYAKFTVVFFQVSFAHGLLKSGTITQLPKEVSVENITFMQDHETEVIAFLQEMQALGKVGQ